MATRGIDDPLMRVLTVLELLQVHERVTGGELARRLEVSPRTVQRYGARLQDLGIPVESTRGVGGAYRLKPGFCLRPLLFTAALRKRWNPSRPCGCGWAAASGSTGRPNCGTCSVCWATGRTPRARARRMLGSPVEMPLLLLVRVPFWGRP